MNLNDLQNRPPIYDIEKLVEIQFFREFKFPSLLIFKVLVLELIENQIILLTGKFLLKIDLQHFHWSDIFNLLKMLIPQQLWAGFCHFNVSQTQPLGCGGLALTVQRKRNLTFYLWAGFIRYHTSCQLWAGLSLLVEGWN